MSTITTVRPAGVVGKKPSPCRFFIPAAENQQLCLICGFTGVEHHICGKKPSGHRPIQMEEWRNKLKSNGNRHTYDVKAELIPRAPQPHFRSNITADKVNITSTTATQPLYSPIVKPLLNGTPVQQNAKVFSQSQTSAFERYNKSSVTPATNNSPTVVDAANYVRIGQIGANGHRKVKIKAVGFAREDQIVGDNGGCEYFIECDNDQITPSNGHEFTPPPLTPEFDPQTLANTLFNGDLKNFKPTSLDVGRLIIGEILQIETTGSLKIKPETARIPIKHSHSESQVPRPMGNSLAPKPPPRTIRTNSDKLVIPSTPDVISNSTTVVDPYVSNVKVAENESRPVLLQKSASDRLPVIHVVDSFSDSNLSSLQSSPDTMKDLSANGPNSDSLSNLLPNGNDNNTVSISSSTEVVPSYTGKKTGKINRELDSKLSELAKDLENLKATPTSNGQMSHSWLVTDNPQLNSTPADVRRSTSSTHLVTTGNSHSYPDGNHIVPLGNTRALSNEMLAEKRTKVQLKGSFEQDNTNSIANGRFSSIRRFLRIEKSSSDSRFSSLSKKWSTSFGRRLDINNPSGRAQIFHSVNEPCEATCQLSESSVKVTELLELSVATPTGSKPNSQQHSPKTPREEDTPDKGNSAEQANNTNANEKPLETDHKTSLLSPATSKDNLLLSADLLKTTQMSESSSSLFSYADLDETDLDMQKLSNSHSQLEMSRYDQLVNINLNSLALITDHLHTIRSGQQQHHHRQAKNLQMKWSQFTLVSQLPLLVTEYAAFYSATSHQLVLQDGHNARVNLMISPAKYSSGAVSLLSQQHHHRHSSLFAPVSTDFVDLVPSKLLKTNYFEDDSGSESTPDDENLISCKVALLPRSMPTTLETYADQTEVKAEKQPDQHEREVTFILIQLLSALKHLQAEGIEEISSDFDTFILLRYTNGRYPHLIILPEALAYGRLNRNKTAPKSLCGFALHTLHLLLHSDKLSSEGFQRVAELLQSERSNSLTQAKLLLEHLLWIKLPLGLSLRGAESLELAIQTWLDRQRAQTVAKILRKLLRRGRDIPDISDELHAAFLLHSTVNQIVDNHKVLTNLENEIIV